MIVTREKERLYLDSWNYNVALIMTELAKIVENHGGRVEPTKHAIISDRYYDQRIEWLKKRISKMEETQELDYREARAKALYNYRLELEQLELQDKKPVSVTHTSFISFVHDGIYYYYQINDNPFFDFHYQKIPINRGYISSCYAQSDKKEWCYDCFMSYDCAYGDIKEAANLIYNMLMMANFSKRYSTQQKKLDF